MIWGIIPTVSVGALLTLLALYFGVSRWVLVRRGQTVTARVTHLRTIHDHENNTDTYQPIVEYTWQGQTHEKATGIAASRPTHQAGDTMTLLIDPTNPTHVVPSSFAEVWMLPIFMGGMGAFFLGIGVVLLIIYILVF